MSTESSVGMWKCEEKRVPPSNELEDSYFERGSSLTSERRPKKNMRSSWQAWAYMLNTPTSGREDGIVYSERHINTRAANTMNTA